MSTSSSVGRKLEQIRLSEMDSKTQIERYQTIINEIFSMRNGNDLTNFTALFNHFLDERSMQVISRPCLVTYAECLKNTSDDFFYELANHAISAIKNHNSSYDEADNILRESLFDYLARQRMFSAAGQILSGLNLESTQKIYSETQKADIYIRCAEAFLEDGEGNEAEIFLNRASPLMHAITDWSLQLRYSVTLARVLDSNRKFVDAALRYYELSTTQNKMIVQDDLLELYGKAITCAILGKAGPQRVRIMTLLQKDERKEQLDKILSHYSSHVAILTKMYNNEIVRPDDMRAFEMTLMDHQKAVAADGFTLSQKAVIEHNLFAAKRIYENILFTELANLVGLDVKLAETVATRMITEGRLKGIIDQSEGVLYFTEFDNETQVWNDSIHQTCNQLHDAVLAIEQLDLVH